MILFLKFPYLSVSCKHSLAEWSKAPDLGSGPKGRGFKSHSCQYFFPLFCEQIPQLSMFFLFLSFARPHKKNLVHSPIICSLSLGLLIFFCMSSLSKWCQTAQPTHIVVVASREAWPMNEWSLRHHTDMDMSNDIITPHKHFQFNSALCIEAVQRNRYQYSVSIKLTTG